MNAPLKASTPVGALVITHEPDLERLADVLAALITQVTGVAVVDDGSSAEQALEIERMADLAGASWLPLEANRGQAAALNHGLAWARERGFALALMLDQDSVPLEGMVERLVGALAAAQESVAAVGPCYVDARDGKESGFWRYRGFRPRQLRRAERGGTVIDCDFLITSGCLVRLAALKTIGTMDERLFIDSVDRDWCYRARALGFSLLGVPAARLDHQLGGRRVGRRIVHSPDRLYYMTRNRVHLYRLVQTPRAWILSDVSRMLAKLVVASTWFGPRRSNLFAMLQGLVDGCRGHLGKRAA